MSEARERYYKCLEGWGYVTPESRDYIAELEQQITELKESQKQKQIIKLCERLDEAKQQNERMLEALIMIYKTWHEDSILISSTKPIIESVTGKPIEEATK